MRTIVSLVLTVGLSAAASASSDKPLRGANCLDPARVRNWIHIDDRHLLVDAGRQKFRVSLSIPCHDLAFSPTISFRGDPVSERVCGFAMDAVTTRDMRCPIVRVEALDAEAWNAATARKPKRDKADSNDKDEQTPAK